MKLQSSRISRLFVAGSHIALLAVLARPARADQLTGPTEPERAPVHELCRICLRTYVHNPGVDPRATLIREECDYTPQLLSAMRRRQLQIATEGTYSVINWEDWGTWYGAHRIESVEAVLLPPCY